MSYTKPTLWVFTKPTHWTSQNPHIEPHKTHTLNLTKPAHWAPQNPHIEPHKAHTYRLSKSTLSAQKTHTLSFTKPTLVLWPSRPLPTLTTTHSHNTFPPPNPSILNHHVTIHHSKIYSFLAQAIYLHWVRREKAKVKGHSPTQPLLAKHATSITHDNLFPLRLLYIVFSHCFFSTLFIKYTQLFLKYMYTKLFLKYTKLFLKYTKLFLK